MRVSMAQLPPGGGDDKIITVGDAAIMLDGAPAPGPSAVTASAYADRLAHHTAGLIVARPDDDLPGILADAITATARELELKAGKSPSSTVVIVRYSRGFADCLVLGDSLAVLAGRPVTDDRLSRISPGLRGQYRARLARGHGYDQRHREIMRELRADQARQRNRPGGYWIAEADPGAARHAITVRLPAGEVPWAVLATDGAYKTMTHLGISDWAALRQATSRDLAGILSRCHSWEADEDPEGQKLPRAKRHDDKSLAVVTLMRQAADDRSVISQAAGGQDSARRSGRASGQDPHRPACAGEHHDPHPRSRNRPTAGRAVPCRRPGR